MSWRILQVSDTHLSRSRAYGKHNWDRIVEHVGRSNYDLVVHTGDIVLDSPDDADDRTFGREQLNRLPAPWLAIPGNHDVGDPSPDAWMGEHVTAERLRAFLDVYDFDSWTHQLGSWTLVGLNAQLLGSGMPGEEAQWARLGAALAAASPGRCVLFMHKPPFLRDFAESGDGNACVLEAARRRLNELVDHRVAAVASGHLHAYRLTRHHGVQYVWAPTTAMISDEENGSTALGRAVNGCVEHEFHEDGSYVVRLLVPAGFRPVDYTGIPAEIPRASRFLPPLR